MEENPIGAELRGRAADLVPLLRANTQRAAHDRRMPEENVTALRDAGLLRLLRPTRFGGYELDMVTKSAVIAELARGCGSTAWVAVLHNDSDYLLGRFPDHLQDLVYADPDALLTTTLVPKGTAERRGDGYVVTARWPFNSGSTSATWAMQPTVCGEDLVQVLIPYSDLVIEDDWDVSGMSASASNTVRADGVFVPADRVVRQLDVVGESHLSECNAGVGLYRIPLIVEPLTSGTAPLSGMARAAFELVREQLDKPIAYTDHATRRDADITYHQIAEAGLVIESADHAAHTACALVDRLIAEGAPFGPPDKARVWGLASYATGRYARAADILRTMAGASAIRTDSRLGLVLRDIQALSVHATMVAPTGMEHYGRSLCGLPPTIPLLE